MHFCVLKLVALSCILSIPSFQVVKRCRADPEVKKISRPEVTMPIPRYGGLPRTHLRTSNPWEQEVKLTRPGWGSRQLEQEGSSRYLEQQGSSRYLRQEGSSPYLEQEGSSHYLKQEGRSRYLKQEGSSRYLKQEGSSPYLKQEDSSPYLKQEGSSRYLKQEGSSRYLEPEDSGRYLEQQGRQWQVDYNDQRWGRQAGPGPWGRRGGHTPGQQWERVEPRRSSSPWGQGGRSWREDGGRDMGGHSGNNTYTEHRDRTSGFQGLVARRQEGAYFQQPRECGFAGQDTGGRLVVNIVIMPVW